MIAKALLAPLLLAQGLRVRRLALRLPEAAGPRAGRAGAGAPALSLLVVGDSSAAGVGVAHQKDALALPLAAQLADHLGGTVDWALCATSGHACVDALAAMRLRGPANPDVLVTVLGVNDVVSQTPVRRWLRQMDALHRTAGARLTLHVAVPPMGRFALLPQPLRWVMGRDAARLDAALMGHVRGDAARRHVPLPLMPDPASDWLAPDGFHPGAAAYRVWAQHLAAVAAAAWRRR